MSNIGLSDPTGDFVRHRQQQLAMQQKSLSLLTGDRILADIDLGKDGSLKLLRNTDTSDPHYIVAYTYQGSTARKRWDLDPCEEIGPLEILFITFHKIDEAKTLNIKSIKKDANDPESLTRYYSQSKLRWYGK